MAGLEPYVFILFGLSAAPSWSRSGPGSRAGRRSCAPSRLAAIVEAIGVAASALFLSPATVILTSVFVGGTFMGLTALGLVAAREGGGDRRGRIALMTASFGFGQILGPSFAGHVYDLTGSLAVPLLAAAAALSSQQGFHFARGPEARGPGGFERAGIVRRRLAGEEDPLVVRQGQGRRCRF